MKKRLFSILAAFLLMISIMPVLGFKANAAENPYPKYQDVDGDGFNEVRCTHYAWQQAYDRLGVVLPEWGHATYWYDAAQKAGYSVGTTAQANSIAVWEIDNHNMGHVAFVTAVNGSQMTVNEGGRTDKDADGNNGVVNGQKNLPTTVGSSWYGRTLKGFIYLADNTDPVSYSDISEGTYYLKNNATGEYLSVSYSQDAQGQNVNAWEYTGIADEQLAFTKADNGYKIRPLCCASRLVNAHGITVESGLNVNIWDDVNDASQWWGFEKVSGGYVVRNMMNPNCVLSISGVREIIVSAYSQADHQIWSIQNTVTFDANGGTGAPAVQFKNYEEPISLSNTVPVREGYAFLGWAFTSDAKTPFYEAGENYTLTSNNNYDLYAVWELRCEPDAHKWDAATCEKAKTCAICGQVEGEPQGHKWVEASCEKAKNCTACGKTEGEPLDHDWQEATCEKAKNCIACGKTEGEPLGHDWVAATCETAATCSRCGKIDGEPLGHAYVDGVCTRCKAEDPDHQKVARGDMNKDGQVNSDDALYLLRNSMNPDRYPIEQNGDVNGDGIANSDDAIYLLRHTMSPERYPLP